MTLTAFTARLGLSQGRLEEDDGVTFVLGDARPGFVHELAAGDHAEVRQSVDLTDTDFVRARLRLRVPSSIPAGLRWVASIRVDGAALASTSCRPGRQRIVEDLAANVSKLAGVHEVAVRLELEEA